MPNAPKRRTRQNHDQPINLEVTPDALLRITTVMQLTGLGERTIWTWVKEGRFPAPERIRPKVTRWRARVVSEWLKANKQP